MDTGNALCFVCGYRACEMFCPCTTPETFLCVQCIGGHTVKGFGGSHTPWKISQLPYYKISGYSERMHMRIELYPQVREQVQQKVQLVDQAIEEFTNEVERVIQELQQYSNKTVGELKEMKAKLIRETEEALAEVERKLVEDSPQFTSDYEQMFRGLTEKLEPFELFSYSVKTSQTLVTLQKHLIPPLQMCLPDQFAALKGNQIEMYDLTTQQIAKNTLAKSTGNAGYIEVDRNTLMIVGKEVMTLDLHTCQITPLPSLLTPRSWPGVAKVNSDVFAFGGFGSDMCEKWSLPQASWTALPNMHCKRSFFTPCYFQSLIYLADTYYSTTIESFNPKTETFTVLPVSLPPQLTLDCGSVAFVASGELCILTNQQQMVRWRVGSESKMRFSVTDRKCWSCRPPLIVGTEVLIAQGASMMKFSLETYSFL